MKMQTLLKSAKFNFRSQVIALLIVALTVIWALLAYQGYASRQGFVHEIKITSNYFITSMAGYVHASFDGFNQHLNSTVELAKHRQWSKKDIRESLVNIIDSSDEIRDALILDRNGLPVDRAAPGLPATYEAHEFFQYFANKGPEVLNEPPFISKLVKDESGNWGLFMSRGLYDENGQFQGVAAVRIKLERLLNTFKTLEMTDGDALGLAHTNGTLLVHTNQKMINRDMSKGVIYTKYLPQSANGSFTSKSLIDGQVRIVTYRSIENFPLVIVTGRPTTVALEQWWKQIGILGVFGGLLSFFLIFGARSLIATVQREEERAALVSEERWKFALEGSGDGIWDYNFETVKNVCSKRLKEILGFDMSAPDADRHLDDWVERLHPDSVAKTMQEFQKVIDNKTDLYAVEQQIRCEDGSYKWLLTRGKVVSRSDDGKPIRLIGTASD